MMLMTRKGEDKPNKGVPVDKEDNGIMITMIMMKNIMMILNDADVNEEKMETN